MGNHYFGHGDPLGNGVLADRNKSSSSTKHVLGARLDPRDPTGDPACPIRGASQWAPVLPW